MKIIIELHGIDEGQVIKIVNDRRYTTCYRGPRDENYGNFYYNTNIKGEQAWAGESDYGLCLAFLWSLYGTLAHRSQIWF